ncbi:MAG: dienelactone hydrolase, partial [Gammaproteobacteria bacterium]
NSYGGGSMAVSNGTVYFTNFNPGVFPTTSDQRIYRQDPGMTPVAITPQLAMTYADGIVDEERKLLICVREDSTTLLNGQPKQSLVGIDTDGRREPIIFAEGYDFYASPCLSPGGDKLAWVSWNYPCMPWDGTELFVADIDRGGHVSNFERIAGGPGLGAQQADNPVASDCACYSNESIMQPRWSPDGVLYFISDRYEAAGSRWWNLYRYRLNQIEAVTQQVMEFGAPMWHLGPSHYDFESEKYLIASFTRNGRWHLARIDTTTASLEEIETDYSSIDQLRVKNGLAYFIGGTFNAPTSVICYDLETSEKSGRTLFQSVPDKLFSSIQPFLSVPEFIRFPTGEQQGEQAYAYYYPPQNPDFSPVGGEKPPLLIFIHGGPSAGISAALSLDVQFFTSRGFAVVDVIYRGSTGFGREFHQALYGYWGIRDVEDCVNAAEYLIDNGRVDKYRIASRGGSAGGYTTLALATFSEILSAATSYYGISNLEMIALHTDKLEAHYAELLVGPYPAAQKVFQARSPYFQASRINSPMVLFQGCDDPVVPPEQARVLIEELLKKGLPVGYEFYPGESHGFRMQSSIQKSLEGELYFYSKIMGFTPAEPLEPVRLHNWPPGSASGGVPEIDFPCT